MKENQNRLLLLLLLPRLLLPKWSPNVERQTILALRRATTARESIDDTLSLGRETRKVDWFRESLRTITGNTLSVNIEQDATQAASWDR
jgi:hypothetical protein